MVTRSLWRIGFIALLVVGLAIGPAVLASPSAPSAAPVALARDNDNGGDDNDNNEGERREIEGQVLAVQCPTVRGSVPEVAAACINLPEGAFIPAVNPGSEPPDLYVHTLDGAVRVVLRDRARLEQIGECNYVRVDGDRISTFLFEAEDIDVIDASGCQFNGNDNNGNDNG